MAKSPRTTPSPSSAPTAPATTIPTSEVSRAFLNLPADSFMLGDREFKIHDLPYDSYIEFLRYLGPLIDLLIQKIAGGQGIALPGISLGPAAFSASGVLSMCGKELPEMVTLICRETDPDITVEIVKTLAKKPTELCAIVLKQIAHNDMIKDFADFFGQIRAVVNPLR